MSIVMLGRSRDGKSLVYRVYRGDGTIGKLRLTDDNGKHRRTLGVGFEPAWQPSR